MNNITDILFQVHENISFKFHSEIALVKGKKKNISMTMQMVQATILNTISANQYERLFECFCTD